MLRRRTSRSRSCSRFVIALACFGLLTACGGSGPADDGANSGSGAAQGAGVLGGGWSFGECAGWCRATIAISHDLVTLTQQTWSGGPDHVITGTLTADGLGRLGAAAVGEAGTLDETYGCPDCADGGAAWITMSFEGGERTSTFEFGAPPPELTAANGFVMQVIDTLSECGAGELVEAAADCEPAPAAGG